MNGRSTTARGLLAAASRVATLALLGACGGGGGGSAGPEPVAGVAGAPYFPLPAGARWRFDTEGTRRVATVGGTTVIDGTTATVLSTTDGVSTEEDYLVLTDSAVSALPGPASDALTRSIGRVDLARFPLRAGSSFVAAERSLGTTLDFDGDGRADPASVRIDVTVIGFERLVATLGTFDDSLHLRTVATFNVTASSSGRPATVTSTADEWYAPGVGQVRGSYRTTGPGGTTTRELALLTYKVGNRSGNAGEPGPTAGLSEPQPSGVSGPGTGVVLLFSADMDSASVGPSAVAVRGPGGTVSGTLAWTGPRTLRFTPAAPLADGPHTVALASGATDLFGVPLASTAPWSFTVDAQAPTAAVRVPAAGSLSPDTVVSLSYSEPMNVDNSPPPTMTVTGPGGALVAGSTAWRGDRTVAFFAQDRLPSGSYTARVEAGASDRAGNAVASATQWQFDIDAFGPLPVGQVPAAGAVSVPVGQVVRVTFDEPVAGSTLNAATVMLTRNGVAVATDVRAQGNDIVITPQAPLSPGTTYRVTISQAVTDAVGNGLGQMVDFGFATEAGTSAASALPVRAPTMGAWTPRSGSSSPAPSAPASSRASRASASASSR